MKNPKIRKKMPISDRARQFAPYAAITELSPALQNIEEDVRENRIELSEDVSRAINESLLSAKVGMSVCLRYFDGARYVAERGSIEKIDKTFRVLTIEGKMIFFDDICAINVKNT